MPSLREQNPGMVFVEDPNSKSGLKPLVIRTQVNETLCQSCPHPGGGGDFQKCCLIFAPEVSIILFFIYKSLEGLSDLEIKNSLGSDAKGLNLYSEVAKISPKIISFNETCPVFNFKVYYFFQVFLDTK